MANDQNVRKAGSDIDSLGDAQHVLNLDIGVMLGAVKFGMPEQQLAAGGGGVPTSGGPV
jgi:hypothetical protein